MLSKHELAEYNNGVLTGLFVDRVFQEYRTYQGEMVPDKIYGLLSY